MKLKPFDECHDCGFWLDDDDCCEFSLTNEQCPILEIDINKFYEEDTREKDNIDEF